MKKIILIIVLLFDIPSISEEPFRFFEVTLFKNNIDIDTKSIKGWIRLFNSREKMNEHKIYLPEEERKIILEELKTVYQKRSIRFTRDKNKKVLKPKINSQYSH